MRLLPLLFLLSMLPGCSKEPTYPLPTGRVELTHLPLPIESAYEYVGIGGPKVLPSAHGGFGLHEPYTFPPSVPVFAVADGVITLLRRGMLTIHTPGPTQGQTYEDWAWTLRISTTLSAHYGHVSALHPSILARAGSVPPITNEHRVSIPVKAGDTLGFVGPHPALDFSIVDRELRLQFVNPSRYPVDYIYGASIIDYLTPALRDRVLSITTRQHPPRGGRHDYDVDGRIIGNWFREGTTGFHQWNRQLGITYHHIYGDRIFISDGSPIADVVGVEGPTQPDQWFVRGNAPRPETVATTSGVIKYELTLPVPGLPPEHDLTHGTMLIELLTPRRMRVEVFKGVHPNQVTTFTSAAHIYER